MLTIENREKLLERLKGHYSDVGALVIPKKVSGDFVRRVLRGEKKSLHVDKAAVKFVEKLDHDAEVLNSRAEQILKSGE